MIKVLDAETKVSLVGVNITWAKGEGMVTDENGNFDKDILKNIKAPIHFSYIGYKDISLYAHQIVGNVILKPSSGSLSEVVISKNGLLTAKQIIDSVKTHLQKNYNYDLTDRKFFLRQQDKGGLNHLDVNITKSSIKEFDNAFAKKMINEMPKDNDFLTEIVGHHYGDLKKQKLLIDEGYKAYDTQNTGYLESYYEKLEAIINKHVKSDSYFKIRTGILSIKTDAENALLKDGEVVDVRNDIGNKKEQANFFLNDRKEMLRAVFEDVFLRKDSDINFLKDAEKYNFEYVDDSTLDDQDVFVLHFSPKSKKKYQGTIYVNQDDFAIVKANFKSTKTIFSFKLFGLSFQEKGNKGTIAFEKEATGKYNIKYIQKIADIAFSIDRPFVIKEKNKNVRGKSTQNKVKFDMLMKGSFQSHFDYVVLNNASLSQSMFQQVDESKSEQPKDWKKHEGNFWKAHPEMSTVENIITTHFK